MEWNDYFIEIAKTVAKKSKDRSTQVGAVIVDSENRPVSFGYNGFIAKADEIYYSHERPLKYSMVIHAEMNAILHANRPLKYCKIYITHAPCANCLKHILQSGINEVYYDSTSLLCRMSKVDAEAITRMIYATNAIVKGSNGMYYNDAIALNPLQDD